MVLQYDLLQRLGIFCCNKQQQHRPLQSSLISDSYDIGSSWSSTEVRLFEWISKILWPARCAFRSICINTVNLRQVGDPALWSILKSRQQRWLIAPLRTRRSVHLVCRREKIDLSAKVKPLPYPSPPISEVRYTYLRKHERALERRYGLRGRKNHRSSKVQSLLEFFV